jgi:hypothetical protein
LSRDAAHGQIEPFSVIAESFIEPERLFLRRAIKGTYLSVEPFHLFRTR